MSKLKEADFYYGVELLTLSSRKKWERAFRLLLGGEYQYANLIEFYNLY